MNPTGPLTKVAKTVTSPDKLMSLTKNKDVMKMVLLFVLLSPGLLVQLPSSNTNQFEVGVNNMKTSHCSVMMHALVLLLVLMYNGVPQHKVMLAVLLFVLLCPGFVLELPSQDDHRLFTNRTSYESIAVHAVVFFVLYGALK